MKLIFCLEINIKVFYKLVLSFLTCIIKHDQNFQNGKFAITLQYDFMPLYVKHAFKVNPHSIVAWISRNSCLETGKISEVEVTATGLQPTAM